MSNDSLNSPTNIATKISGCSFSRDKFDFVARLLVLLGIFFIPLSGGMVDKIFPAAIFCTLIAGNWKYKWDLVKKERALIVGLMLLAFMTIGIFYSKVPIHYTLQGYFKYTKLIYLLFLLPLFVEYRWRRIAENVLMISVFINAIVALLNVHGLPVFGKTADIVGSYFIHQIYTSVLTSFTAFILANRAFDAKKYKWIYGILLIFTLYILFFVYIERTGYVIAFALFLIFLVQRLHWKGIIAALLIIPLFIGAVYLGSPVFHKRIHDFTNDLVEYGKKNERTSTGYRIAFIKYSLPIIKENLIFGSGPGSFRYLYPKTGGPTLDDKIPLGHPHNEYVLILFQSGAIGLLLFLFWIGIMLHDSFRLPIEERRLAQGLIATFFINGFCNASLVINSTGMILIVFISIYFAARNKENLKFPQ